MTNPSPFARDIVEYPRDKDRWIAAFRRSRTSTASGVHRVELVDINDDLGVFEMPIGDHARQPMGLLHGGVSLLLAETAASTHACWGIDLTERVPVGVEVSASHTDSATDGVVRATASVIKRGRTLIRHRVRVEHVDSGRLLSQARVTNLYKSLP